MTFEPIIEPKFLPDSYGYRPGKSALDAIGVTRKRCWEYDWVLEFDIKGLFDNIDHELLMRAVKHHTECKWVILYIERWLKAPMQMEDGKLVERQIGTPQGGVISPCLANLFLHYVFDVWITRMLPGNPWCRYADDGLTHCKTEQEAEAMKAKLQARFSECGLTMHPDKTKIIYCKDGMRKGNYPNKKFDFLSYTFRPRWVRNRTRKNLFVGFTPAVSSMAIKSMRQTIRKWNIRNRTELGLEEIAHMYNPVLRGWYGYYGKYNPSELHPVWHHFHQTLVAWAMRKYKRFRGHKMLANQFINKMSKERPDLFMHWKYERSKTGFA